MWISELTIVNCRIIEKLTLEFSPHVNFIYGSNGSGKTSILEALSLLSYGRSFRTSRISDVITYNKRSVISSAIVSNDSCEKKRIGIEKSSKKTTIHVNRQAVTSQSQLSKLIPVSFIHPLSHELITGGSFMRRSFIDWIAFYRHKEFHELWKQYQRLLKQRNAALKNPRLYYALDHLTEEICKIQLPIHNYRISSLSLLNQTLKSLVPDSLASFIPDIELNSGLPKQQSLEAYELFKYYESIYDYEKKRGRTIRGVHAANLSISLESVLVAASASRGQTKAISILLHLCQNIAINQSAIICIDDISAEFDLDNHTNLLDFILSLNNQTFITSTSKSSFKSLETESSLFHVEQGFMV